MAPEREPKTRRRRRKNQLLSGTNWLTASRRLKMSNGRRRQASKWPHLAGLLLAIIFSFLIAVTTSLAQQSISSPSPLSSPQSSNQRGTSQFARRMDSKMDSGTQQSTELQQNQSTSPPARGDDHHSSTTNTSPSAARRIGGGGANSEVDPMEPCYLANNRASESLTISESTPVGTVVGELMVNGDSSKDGNIELSIRMPSGPSYGLDSSRQIVGVQRHGQAPWSLATNYPALSTNLQASSRGSGSTSSLANANVNDDSGDGYDLKPPSSNQRSQHLSPDSGLRSNDLRIGSSSPKSTRDLSNLIDLMPPLSIEQGTKRLILAKKLDREDLEKYILAGGYQASSINSLSQASSASLTVHINCQLRDNTIEGNYHEVGVNSTSNSMTHNPSPSLSRGASPSKSMISKSSSSTNSISIPIHLIITDENDNWPNFISAPYIIDLNETAQIGTLLQGNEIVAVDNDQQGPLSTIEYSIVPGSLWSDSFAFINPLDSRSLIVKDSKLLDYESETKLTLKVMARDQGEPPNWAITSLYINLIDQDDMNPIFGEDKYTGLIKENRPGELIDLEPKRLIARDGDKTLQSPVIYSFHLRTNHSIHFDLDADLGKLSLKKTLPTDDAKLAQQPFCLIIKATQVNNPHRWTLTVINLRLARLSGEQAEGPIGRLMSPPNVERLSTLSNSLMDNSNEFKFQQANFSVEISEAAHVGSTILTVKASYGAMRAISQDRTTTSVPAVIVTYQLLDNELGYFNLDEQSGRITLNKSLDYELYRELSIRILASHEQIDDSAGAKRIPVGPGKVIGGSYPKLVCDITRVNIRVINNNDFSPEFSHELYNFQLSVSDLIASFESETPQNDDQERESERAEELRSDYFKKKFSKRFSIAAAAAAANSNSDPTDEQAADSDPAFRVLQLGQIYCADRDHGDRVTLQLFGSKASLFHLTQDGRLYLPLINVSNHFASGLGQTNGGDMLPGEGGSGSQSGSWSRSQPRTINNQNMPSSRQFMSRRMDFQHHASLDGPLDRNYLNYLLSELTNLSRLRLKVVATDDGKPETRQSNALIVVTIISIDNFIIQRTSSPTTATSASDKTASIIKLFNETTHDTSRDERDAADIRYHRSQVMMIPSTNGKGFVQISSDIVSNLLSSSNVGQPRNSSGSIEQIEEWDSRTRSQRNTSSLAKNIHAESLDAVASSNTAGPIDLPVNSHRLVSNSLRSLQPPSLLLVDDEGAKFVATPTAIEVLNRQVQEAAGQQVRKAADASSKRFRDHHRQEGGSLWSLWKGQFSFGSDSANEPQVVGPAYWINVSTPVILHLLIIVAIITLLTKLKSSLNRSNDSIASTASSSSESNFWPRRFPKLPPLLGRSGSGRQPVVSILDGTIVSSAGSYGNVRACRTAEDTSSISTSQQPSRYAFSAHQNLSSSTPQTLQTGGNSNNNLLLAHGSSTDLGGNTSGLVNYQRRKQSVSAGIIVSTMSGGTRKLRTSITAMEAPNRTDERNNPPALEHSRHQNLFSHLKLTLNKVLDLGDASKQSCIGQVTVKPLDEDSIKFDDCIGRQLDADDSSSSGSAASGSHESELSRQSDMQLAEAKATLNAPTINSSGQAKSISTFIGHSYNHRSGNQQSVSNSLNGSQQCSQMADTEPATITTNTRNSSGNLCTATVVSINVTAPKAPVEVETNPRSPSHQTSKFSHSNHHHSSSSSSVVSLISMNSSISNKISAAVRRTNEGATGSDDVSSLDSSTLFRNACQSMSEDSTAALDRSRASQRTTTKSLAPQPPPPPPPLPPPPSLVQATATIGGSCNLSPSHSPRSIREYPSPSRPFSSRPELVSAGANASRLPPQNPMHMRLRKQAMNEHSSVPSSSLTSPVSYHHRPSTSSPSSIRGFGVTQTKTPQAVAGRREERQQAAGISAAISQSPPTPPPLPNNIMGGVLLGSGDSKGKVLQYRNHNQKSIESVTKTVSPTTSVDRGYESFQSYTSSSQQQRTQRSQTASQTFSSLQESYPDLTNMNNLDSRHNIHDHHHYHSPSTVQTSGRGSVKVQRASDQAKNMDRSARSRVSSNCQKSRSSAHHREEHRLHTGASAATSAINEEEILAARRAKMECDTEDDDFYYCSTSETGDHSHLETQPDRSPQPLSVLLAHPQAPCTGLLSEYASHTYQQRAAPACGRRVISELHGSSQRQLANGQRKAAKTSVKGRGSAFFANNTRGGHDLEKQRPSPYQVSDLASRRKYSEPDEDLLHSQARGRTSKLQQQRHLAQQTHRGHYHQSNNQLHGHPKSGQNTNMLSGAYGGGHPNKKQLTWSDQIEMAP